MFGGLAEAGGNFIYTANCDTNGTSERIVGAPRLTRLEDNLGAPTPTLSDEHLERLDAVSRVGMGFPLDVLERTAPQISGETPGAIDVVR